MIENILNTLDKLLSGHFGAVLAIVFGAYVALLLLMLLIEKVIRQLVRASSFKTKRDERQREDTLISLLRRTIRVFIIIIAGFMVLAEVGLDVAPLLAGAGVAGVALGFGAQTMVKDYLAGFFIIAENQYRVGDVLQINRDVSGVVEHITLRVTVLRDLEGMVHHIPNGQIEISTNMTMDYAQVDLNLRVSYDSDIDHVEKVINQVGEDIFANQKWQDIILEAPAMERVNEFTESAIVIKVLCKTAPMSQWEVKGEILRQVKKAFAKEGIVIPYPEYVVKHVEGKK